MNASISASQKVSLFIPNLERGGAERMMVHLANAFSMEGLSVDLVVAKNTGPYRHDVSDNVRLVSLDTSFSNPLILLRLAGYLRRTRPLAVLSAMTYPNVALLAASILAGGHSTIVISERTTLSVQSKHSASIREKLKPITARCFYRYAKNVVAISKGVGNDLIKTTGIAAKNLRTIYNPVVTSNLFDSHPRPDHPFYKSKHQPIIVAAGRLVPQKDFSTLISAFSAVHAKIDSRLIILGEGPLREELQNQVNSLGLGGAVSLTGAVNNPFDYMKHADLFVLSSAWEGFGNVLVEAMACGCPVVSTACPSGPSEILREGEFGALVPPRDHPALANAILATLNNPSRPEHLISRARDFSAQKIARQYLSVMLNSKKQNNPDGINPENYDG